MELDYSCLNEKPNQEVMTFLETASIRKITISQQSKTCEIFLACESLPDGAMYMQCLQFFTNSMAKASKVRLIVQPKNLIALHDFFENHYDLFVTMLTEQHPSISGWLFNSRWQLVDEQIVITIGQEIGLKFLQNM